MLPISTRIETVLSGARESLRSEMRVGSEEIARRAVVGCRDFLSLFSMPGYETLDPRGVVSSVEGRFDKASYGFRLEPVRDCVLDASKVDILVTALLNAFALHQDSSLAVELFEEKDIPQLAISLDGPGSLSDEIRLNGAVQTSLEELRPCWTLATKGGRFDPTPNGLLLKLAGVRVLPEVSAECDALRVTLEAACAAADASSLLKGIDGALAVLDADPRPPEPCDIKALWADIVDDYAERFENAGIRSETLEVSSSPPVVVRRKRLRATLELLTDAALSTLPSGGLISSMFEYDVSPRELQAVFTLEGPRYTTFDSSYTASLRRTVQEVHSGTVEIAESPHVCTVSVTLPDTVGRALDLWIPGYEVFCDKSKQVLRLLKSGGQVPPEEILLPIVLEEELERWLLPKLAEPAAVNLAHETKPKNDGLLGTSKERLDKAMEQIRKGKLRKEIAGPAYAAEILFAFRSDERRRGAVGAEKLDVKEIERLCAMLLQAQCPFVECLRLIAKARN